MALMVLVVEVEQEPGDEDLAALRTAMFEVRDRLQALDVPIRRAWAGAGERAEAVSALHGDDEDR